MTDCVITGIWFSRKDGKRFVSHVMLHQYMGDSISLPGLKKDKNYIIDILGTISVSTAKWNYDSAKWEVGEKITTEHRGADVFLRTAADTPDKNYLELLPDMLYFFG